jgi:subtilisin-like proprotein convertase family protein
MKLLSLFSLLFINFVVLQGQHFFTISNDVPSHMKISEDFPDKYQSYELDVDKIREYTGVLNSNAKNKLKLYLPDPRGKMIEFEVFEALVVEPGLALKYPNIRTFKGFSADRRMVTRFDLGPYGFHASVRSPKGEYYIDPASRSSQNYVVAYYLDEQDPDKYSFTCGVEEKIHPIRLRDMQKSLTVNSDKVEFLQYRIAIACTGVFGQLRGSVENALADIITANNRLNQIFENELGVRFVLIEDNDKVVFIDPNNDPYENPGVGGEILRQNTRILDQFVGRQSYDLGHVFTRGCSDVGGVAFGSGLCDPTFGPNNRKGAGVTCNPNQVRINTAAHEIGHQLSASHTWTRCGGGSEGQFAQGTAFEPGSGNTIMSYANLCGSDNVPGGSFDTYHWGSLNQMYNFMRTEGFSGYECAQKVLSDNHLPVVEIDISNNLHIPINTPFYLTGTVTDQDEDQLSYSWEQVNSSPASVALGEVVGDGAAFRVFRPGNSPTRIIPRPVNLFSNLGTNDELLPSYSRRLDFALVVRDNNPEIGGVSWDFARFRATDIAGPFMVISPNGGENLRAGSKVDVRWDVSNTDQAPVNCQFVDIYLSMNQALFDGSSNFIQLAAKVPNNGLAEVIIPNVTTTSGRIVVVGHENIFFDISNFNIGIQESDVPVAYFETNTFFDNLCLPNTTEVEVSTAGLGGFEGIMHFDVTGVPEGANLNFSKDQIEAGDLFTIGFDFSNEVPTGVYQVIIKGSGEDTDTLERIFTVQVVSTDFSDFTVVGPENGKTGTELVPFFNWTEAFNATEYEFQLSTSPAFPPNETLVINTTSTNYIPLATLDRATVHYWRVKPINICSDEEFSETWVFNTAVLQCQSFQQDNDRRLISPTGTPTVEQDVIIPLDGQLEEIGVKNLRINHTMFNDLRVSLVAPDGEAAVIFDRICFGSRSMNHGFSDNAPGPFNCAFVGTQQFQPVQAFDKFKGKDIFGLWKIRVEDTRPENGGELTTFTLEVCTNVSFSPPFVVHNDTLRIRPNANEPISSEILLVDDADSGPQDLVYTLVDNVRNGYLTLDGSIINIGAKFTQQQINDRRLRYFQTEENDDDSFKFIVEDGLGGWISVTNFNILVDENATSNTLEVSKAELDVSVYPNPAFDQVNILIHESLNENVKFTITDINGRLVSNGIIQGNHSAIDLWNLNSGIYILGLHTSRGNAIHKLIVQK